MTSRALKTGAARAKTPAFPPEFKQKVDMTKVNVPLIQNWVTQEVARILNNEDDIVIGMIHTMLENKTPDIKKLQTDTAGFLDNDTAAFCLSLWKLCLSAQEDPNGIPKELIEAKKQELQQERLAEIEARERKRERERELDEQRDREREERESRGHRGGGGRGGRGYDNDHSRRPPPRRSRSPPRRFELPSRRLDSYQPPARGRGGGRRPDNDAPRRRARSSSDERSPSRDRSPPRRRRRRNSSSDISRSPPRRRSRDLSSDSEEDTTDKHSHAAKHRRSRSPSPRRRQRSPARRGRMRSPSPRRRRSRSSSTARRDRRSRERSSPDRSSRNKRRRSPGELFSKKDRPSDSLRLKKPTRSTSSRSSSVGERRNPQGYSKRGSVRSVSSDEGANESDKVG